MNRFVILALAVAALSAVAARRNSIGNGKKMVCYVGTWAMYRPGDGKFEMEDIDPELCTHVMYGFTKLENNQITVFDPWGDLKDEWGGGRDGYRRFTNLKKKNPELKTIVAIGGWNEGSTKYSDMSKDPSARRTFVQSIVPFLEKYNFDGLDLDWEYPTQRGGQPEDRENFSALVRELRAELDRAGRGYLLTAAVTPNTKVVDIAYEVKEIARDLDFINVMCYDYHGFWDGHDFTGHNTPLYNHPDDVKFEPTFNANDTVQYWLQAGLPKEKLIMGMALYGRGFTLQREEEHGLYAPTTGGIPQGPYTRQAGIWGYNEICEKYQTEMSQWKITIDPYVKAPYAYNGRNWIGYEDAESIYYKAEYAREMDLGGAMVWSLETDDFRGKCHGEKYILLRTIVNTLNGGGKPNIPQRPDAEYENAPIGSGGAPPADLPPQGKPNNKEPTHAPSTGGSRPSRTPRPNSPTRTPRTTTAGSTDYETTQSPLGDGATSRPNSRRTPRPSSPTRTPRTTTSGSVDERTTPGPSDDYDVTTRPTRRTPRPSRRPPSESSTNGNDHFVDKTTKRPPPPPPPTSSSNDQASGQCTEEGLFPEGNCSGFYHCVRRGKGYQKVPQMCPAGTAFNPEIKGCDHAENVPGCAAIVRSSNSYRPDGQQLIN